jgi:hypothetical protein
MKIRIKVGQCYITKNVLPGQKVTIIFIDRIFMSLLNQAFEKQKQESSKE